MANYHSNTLEGLLGELSDAQRQVADLKVENQELKNLISCLCEGTSCAYCCLSCPIRAEDYQEVDYEMPI